MTTTSGDPQRLAHFVESAAPLTRELAAAAEAALGTYSRLLNNSTFAAPELGSLQKMAQWLGELEATEVFVAAVAEALASADGWRGTSLSTIHDASLDQAIPGIGDLAPDGSFTVPDSALLGDAPTSGFADDPVCTATGNFCHHETDLAFPARAGLLNLSRTYNSLAYRRPGAFGPGWSSLLDVRLVVSTQDPTVFLPDGAEIVAEARRLRLRHLDSGAWELADGPQTFAFDDTGTLTALALGRSRLQVERSEGRVVRLLETTSGRWVAFSWEQGRVTAATSSDGRSTSYAYDADGHLIEVTRPSGAVAYRMDDAGRIASVVDADGVVTVANTYDEEGRVATQKSPFGRVSSYAYGRHGVCVVTDTGGLARNAFVHDRRANLVAMVGADGAALRLRYDHAGRLTGWRDRRGAETTLSWDEAAERPLGRVGPGGAESFEWDDQGRLTAHHSPAGTTSWVYEAGRRTPVRIHEPGGGVTTIAVSDDDLPPEVTDPDGVTTRYSFDADGQITGLTDALGSTTRFHHDPAGQLTGATLASGATLRTRSDPTWSPAGRALGGTDPVEGPWTATYGPHGAVCELTGANAHTVALAYDPAGNISEITGPDGRTYRQAHDGACRLVAATDPAGATWGYEYDPEGALVGVVDPTGAATQRQVDALGRTVSETDAAGRTWTRTWGPDGRLAQVRDPKGSLTTYDYDQAGNLTGIALDDTPLLECSWTPAGRLARQRVLSGPEVAFGYDQAGRLSSVKDDQGHLRIVSDVDGRPVRALDDRGRRWALERDEHGRVVAAIDPRGRTRRFGLDDAGRTTSASDASGSATFAWDGAQLTACTDALGAGTSYRYDQAGRLAEVTGPLGATTHLGYDPAGRLSELTDPTGATARLLRNPAGALVGVSYPEGGGIKRWADPAGVTLGYSAPDAPAPTVLLRRDAAGDLAGLPPPGSLRPAPRLPAPEGLGFDASGRVVATPGGDRYRHDAAGQLVEWASPDGEVVTYSYDPGGRLVAERTGDAETTYAYDPAGRLLRRVGADGGTTTFTYDPAGRRITEQGPGDSWVRYQWDDAGRLAAIVRTQGEHTTRNDFAYDNLGLPIQIGSVEVSWDLTTGWPVVDRIGGEPSKPAQEDLDPWGAGPGKGVRLGYRGELCIDHLVWLRARPYDPTTRSFLAPDPLPNPPGAPCGANPYHYAWNDPVSLVDPAGLRPLTQEEFDHRRHIDEIGGLRQAGEAISKDPWGSLALGLTIAVGVGLCFVPGAGIVGAGILIGVGTSTAMGVATGTFDPRSVAFSGDLGGLTGGIGGGVAASGLGALSKMGAMALVGGADNAAMQGYAGAPLNWRSVAGGAAIGGGATSLGIAIDELFGSGDPLGRLRSLLHDEEGGAQQWTIKARLRAAGPGDELGLPYRGTFRFLPQEDYNPNVPLQRGPRGSYMDRFGNHWRVGPPRILGHTFEWDVELSRTGRARLFWALRDPDQTHINVSPLGELTHKFPKVGAL